jgi:hypothetical protein
MQQFDSYIQEKENERRMQEAQQWAANERLARHARAGQASSTGRTSGPGQFIWMLLNGLRRRRAPRRRAAAPTMKLSQGDILIL